MMHPYFFSNSFEVRKDNEDHLVPLAWNDMMKQQRHAGLIWSNFGQSGAVLDSSGAWSAHLGPSLTHLEVSWSRFGIFLCWLELISSFLLGCLGPLLSFSWAFLGLSWACLGMSWNILTSLAHVLGCLGPPLGLSWDVLQLSLAVFRKPPNRLANYKLELILSEPPELPDATEPLEPNRGAILRVWIIYMNLAQIYNL